MSYTMNNQRTIRLTRVSLDGKNPRHEPLKSQNSIIKYLCRNERVVLLAQDIVKKGLNPLEIFGLISDGSRNYVTVEGNRRLCALILLHNSDLAPVEFKNQFEKMSENWEPIKEIPAIVFRNREDAKLWLDRIHAGFNGGVGRRQWVAEQKARHSGYKRNVLAQSLLDAAQKQNLISADDRNRKISTVERYLGNPVMKDALGISGSKSSSALTEMPAPEFSIVLGKFMSDVADQTVNTRHNAADIKKYARTLTKLDGVTGKRVAARPVAKTLRAVSPRRVKKNMKPKKLETIEHIDELKEALSETKNQKLVEFYYSLCSVKLDHALMLYVGAWSFLEALTALCGRSSGKDFSSFIYERLDKYEISERHEKKVVQQAVKNIADWGNITKHHKKAGGFDGQQLASDFGVLEDLLIALAQDAKGKK